MIKINGEAIESECIEWGVRFSDNEVYQAHDEADARFVVALSESSKLMARKVYETAWAEVAK